MTTQPISSLRSIRVLLVTLALALASTVGFAASDVSADVLVPARDIGVSGGGGGLGDKIDETTRAQNLDALTIGGFAEQVDESERAQNLDELTSGGAVAKLATNPYAERTAF